jgi:hypothetical protein
VKAFDIETLAIAAPIKTTAFQEATAVLADSISRIAGSSR